MRKKDGSKSNFNGHHAPVLFIPRIYCNNNVQFCKNKLLLLMIANVVYMTLCRR